MSVGLSQRVVIWGTFQECWQVEVGPRLGNCKRSGTCRENLIVELADDSGMTVNGSDTKYVAIASKAAVTACIFENAWISMFSILFSNPCRLVRCSECAVSKYNRTMSLIERTKNRGSLVLSLVSSRCSRQRCRIVG